MGWRDEAILVSGLPHQQPVPPEAQPLAPPQSRGAPSWRDEAVLVSAPRSPVEAQLSQGPPGPGLSPEAQEHAIGEATRQLEASMTPGFLAWGTETGGDFISPIARVVGQGGYADAMNRWTATMEQAQRQREEGGPVPDIIQRGVRGAGRSMLPMVVAARVGGSYAAIGVAAAQEANRAITEGKDAGLKGWDLAQYAVVQGVVEALPAIVMQKFGWGGAETLAAKKGLIAGSIRDGLKALGVSFAREVPEEVVTELSHDVAAKLAGVQEGELTEGWGNIIKETVVQTGFTVGGLGGVQIARGSAEARQQQETRERVHELAESGKPVSRKDWRGLGFPKNLDENQAQRTRYVKELSRNIQIENELESRAAMGQQESQPEAGEPVTPEIVAEQESQEAAPKQPAPWVTSVRNEIVDRIRAEQGRGRITGVEAVTHQQLLDSASQSLTRDPFLGDKLLKELAENPRAVGPGETAVLQIQYQKMSRAIRNAHTALSEANKSGDAAAINRAQALANAASNETGDAEQTFRTIGRITARSLGARKMLLHEDFSLETMTSKLGIARGGKTITAEELTRVQELDRRIVETQDKIARKETEIEESESSSAEDSKRLKALKRGLRRGIRETRRRIVEGDFSKRKTKKTVLDKEAVDLKFELKGLKNEFKGMESEAEWQKMPLEERSIKQLHSALNASRSILTSFDLSALLRQGALAAYSHPFLAARNVAPMLRSFWSEKGAFEAMEEMEGSPYAALRAKSGLAVTTVDGPLSSQEEVFQGEFAEKYVPGVAASERAYVTFLNRIRADVFDSLAATLGVNGEVTDAEAKMIAYYVNVITGRGGLGKAEQAATTLAIYFFAPRYVASRFQFLTGMPIWKAKGRARTLIAKEYAKTVIGAGTFMGSLVMLMNLFKDDDDPEAVVEFDARSADLWKVRIGNTRIDPLAGLSQVTVLLRRLQTGQRKTSTGKIVDIRGPGRTYTGLAASDVMANFLRSKLAPVPGAVVDILAGENLVGEPTTPQSVARGTLIPLAVNDILDVMTEDYNIPTKVAVSLLTVAGAGAQTYDSATPGRFAEDIAAHPKMIGVNEKGETYDHTAEIAQVVAEASRLGHSPEDMMYDMDERMRASGVRAASRAAKLKRFLGRWNLFSDLQQQRAE